MSEQLKESVLTTKILIEILGFEYLSICEVISSPFSYIDKIERIDSTDIAPTFPPTLPVA